MRAKTLSISEFKKISGKYSDDVKIQCIFLSRLPETWQLVLVTVVDSQSLQKLVDAADKMADVTPKDTAINHMQTSEADSVAELIQLYMKISEKLGVTKYYGRGFWLVFHYLRTKYS